MKLTYKELEIELELAGLLAVEELVLKSREMNWSPCPLTPA